MPHSIRPILSFIDKAGHRASEERFKLLSAIDREGSISAAAKQLSLSYKGAWDAVHALNNLFSTPLVIARPGGKRGGGAQLTEEGRKALQAHQYLTGRLNDFVAQIEREMTGNLEDTFHSSPLLWSFSMRTSARNVFHGIVEDITLGAVNSEVTLRVSDNIHLAVIITNKSAEALALEKGSEAFALIKASAPILMAEDDKVRLSARNQLSGTVLSVEEGSVNSEVTLDLGEGKTLAIIITKQSAETLDAKTGDRMRALIKAPQIILGVE